MYIIGTAGHVDHGKTTLVKALTGVDTDRLPEEKRRKLTIELGFASFLDPYGQKVGVVDVPGHERFIRNMAGGMWGLDLVLLLVAADDGWMCQSEDHLQIIKGMGVPEVILVITKCDIASNDRILEVSHEAQQRCMAVLGYNPDLFVVGALTSEGIDSLAQAIGQTLQRVKKNTIPPCLYIDRSFILEGIGPVVTGSLRGNELQVGEEFILLPTHKKGRIRSLQSFGSSVSRAEADGRTAIGVQGIEFAQLRKGYCITTDAQRFSVTTQALVVLKHPEIGKTVEIRNHGKYEVAYGTNHDGCSLHVIARNPDFLMARIVCDHPSVWYWRQPFVCILPGGSSVVAHGHIISTRKWNKSETRQIVQLCDENPSPLETIGSHEQFELLLDGYAFIEDHVETMLKFLDQDYNGYNGWFIRKDIEKAIIEQILEMAKRGRGVPLETVKQGSYPPPLMNLVIQHLVEKKFISLENGMLKHNAIGVHQLSSAAKELLGRIEKSGMQGFPVKDLQKSEKELLGKLLDTRKVMMVESLFIYTTETYRTMTALVLKGRAAGETFTIGDAKLHLPLSRKYMIPLLNRMEEDGFIERIGDMRKVL
jgi:selenocysteine-specific elongation factor